MKIGKMLRQYRLLTEQTHQQLADEVGVSRASILRMEAGKSVGADKVAAVISWLFR